MANQHTRTLWVVLALALVTGLGYVDFLTGNISLVLLYLVPITLTTWYVGRWAGVGISLASSLAWLASFIMSKEYHGSVLISTFNESMALSTFFIITFLLSTVKTTLEHERQLSRIDFLTQAMNGRYFEVLAQSELERSRRYQHPFTLAYLDLDDFKTVNDRFGHHTGNDVLRVVSATVKANIRATDVLARLGGDEFALLLPETDPQQAQIVLQKVKERWREVMQKEGWAVTLSIGAASFLKPPDSVDEMIHQADALMYEAKQEGKDRICYSVFGKEVTK
jgi:diguanylate cyclase (GGDEF)-like protein